MTSMPDYERPPVVEVAMGVQFQQIDGLTAVHVGRYWETVKDEFPMMEDRGPLPHIIEPKDQPTSAGEARITFSTRPDWGRVWLRDEPRNQLIQVQRDHFHYNWLKQQPSDVYQRYRRIKPNFFERWKQFCSFLGDIDIAEPVVDQCEIAYVNIIGKEEGWEGMGDLAKILPLFRQPTRSEFLPDPSMLGLTMSYPLPEHQGRLHINIRPTIRLPQGDAVLRFGLTSRGRSAAEMTTDILEEWFDLGHEWIVKGFADLVTAETDDAWGRKS